MLSTCLTFSDLSEVRIEGLIEFVYEFFEQKRAMICL